MGPSTSVCGDALLERNLTIDLFLLNLKLFAFKVWGFFFNFFKKHFDLMPFLKKNFYSKFWKLQKLVTAKTLSIIPLFFLEYPITMFRDF